MNASMDNGKFWIPIIIGLFTAFSGVTFGLIKAEQARNQIIVKEQITSIESKINDQNNRIYGTESRMAVMERLMDLYHPHSK